MNNENDINTKHLGKDGQFINMAFTDDNYNFIVNEASRLNSHFTSILNFFINSIHENDIEDFLARNPIRKSKSLASKRKGEPLKRIYFKLSNENYERIRACAEQNNSSNTVIVNVILEICRQKFLLQETTK